MIQKQMIEGYEAFSQFVQNIDVAGPQVVFYFSGSKIEGTDRSWCGDCQDAQPILYNYLESVTKDYIFVHVNVGDRPYWKDNECPFRTDPKTRLLVIPTLIKWNGVQRLEGGQCGNPDLLEIFFNDEDD